MNDRCRQNSSFPSSGSNIFFVSAAGFSLHNLKNLSCRRAFPDVLFFFLSGRTLSLPAGFYTGITVLLRNTQYVQESMSRHRLRIDDSGSITVVTCRIRSALTVIPFISFLGTTPFHITGAHTLDCFFTFAFRAYFFTFSRCGGC